MTRRQASIFLDKISEHVQNDIQLQAKLHGMKLKATPGTNKFKKKDSEKLKSLAEERYEQMLKGI